MKKLLFATAFLLSLSAQANTIESVFSETSPIPQTLQRRILGEVEARCASVLEGTLKEEVTRARSEAPDPDQLPDNFYTSRFTALVDTQEGPQQALIYVESVAYGFSNPRVDNLAILHVLGDRDDLCH